jgi:hypothetical protein
MTGSSPLDQILWQSVKKLKYGLNGVLWIFGNQITVCCIDVVVDPPTQLECIDTIQRGFSAEPNQLAPTSGRSRRVQLS